MLLPQTQVSQAPLAMPGLREIEEQQGVMFLSELQGS